MGVSLIAPLLVTVFTAVSPQTDEGRPFADKESQATVRAENRPVKESARYFDCTFDEFNVYRCRP